MLFSWNFQFRENGKVVGEMDRSLWRESAELALNDGRYTFYRDQIIGGDYVIDHKGNILARASKPSWWRSTFRPTGLSSIALFFFGSAR